MAGLAVRRAARRLAAWAPFMAAVIAAAALAVGAVSYAGVRPARNAAVQAALTPAGGHQAARLRLSYGCASPAGQRQIIVLLSAAFPVRVSTGTPIAATGSQIAITIPAATIAALAPPHAASVAASARLTMTVALRRVSAAAAWTALTAPATAIPVQGSLVTTVSGAAAPVTVSSPGPVTFRPAALSVVLTWAAAAGGASPSPAASPAGPPASPAASSLACTPDAGQRTSLATVTVACAAARGKAPLAVAAPCPPEPKGGLKLNPRFPLPKPPKGSKILFPEPADGCAYVKGFADVAKLNGASLLGPALTDLALDVRVVQKLTPPIYYEIDTPAQLEYRSCATCQLVHGFPPAKATFLGFGFVPVTAVMQLTEVGTININSVGSGFALATNTVWSELTLRIHDVTVNGTPLDVGSRCQSVTPFLAKLVGTITSKPPYSLQNGGPLTGLVNIPAFTGCGVTENLDPLFTGAVSGERNFNELTQGALCPLIGTGTCPPPIPVPLR